MTLEEAIRHARSIEKDSSECKECNLEHKQLADWLEELRTLRAQNVLQKQIAKPCRESEGQKEKHGSKMPEAVVDFIRHRFMTRQ